MRHQGRLQDWNDEKGYGFVVPNGGGERAFVHIKAFEQRGQRPGNGMLISYAVRKDERNRLNATAVRLTGGMRAGTTTAPRGRPVASGHTSRHLPRVALGLAALSLLALCSWLKWIPEWSALAIAGFSLAALVLYAQDKAAAQRGRWRTPENTLHLIALLGGWPGALMAQGLFHHKRSKRSFLAMFWLTVLVNCVALYLLATGRFSAMT